MTQAIAIEGFRVTGFRAYLAGQAFSLYRGNTPLSLAVFAPNAKGKSGLVDAFEFYFSENATLRRLGIRQAEGNAGRLALEHVDAQAKGVTPTIEFSFREGVEKFGDSRAVVAQGTAVPAAARRVLESCVVPFVIRGYELRAFVEGQTPEQRYEEIVAWFGLQPLLIIQRNLRALRRQVKGKAESTTDRQERLRDLGRITGNALMEWDDVNVLKWLNEQVLARLDSTLTVATLSADDTGYKELKRRKVAEDETLGISSLKRLLRQIEAVSRPPAEHAGDAPAAIVQFENTVTHYNTAVAKEGEERARASQAAFSGVWSAAKAVLECTDIPLEACPVCDMEFSATPHGSRDAVRLNVMMKLDELTAYEDAEKAVANAKETLLRGHRALRDNLAALTASLKDAGYADHSGAIDVYERALSIWSAGSQGPDSAAATSQCETLHGGISTKKKKIEEQQGEHTYAIVLTNAHSLIELKKDLYRIERFRMELLQLSTELSRQAQIINKAIIDHTHTLVSQLRDSVNALYKDIQGGGTEAPPIRFDLPDDEDINQQRIQLLIDFADNRKGVVPTGYLSDSHIHTLALSLRLAAIQLFNRRLPVVVFDDVVTSYDADHRKNIAAMLAKHFASYQIIVVTHDERFFMLLQEHLPQGSWSFRRITEVKAEFGPVFHDHRTPDEVIEVKLDSGQSAANEIRQAEEEWLLDICRDLRAKIVIRPVDRPYKYDRSELAGALAACLKDAGIVAPLVPGIANPFSASLQRGDVENFGSHFSDNPSASASVGDEQSRWAEFVYFRNQFSCPGCGSKRFMRPEPLKHPLCKKCETPFAFKAKQLGS